MKKNQHENNSLPSPVLHAMWLPGNGAFSLLAVYETNRIQIGITWRLKR